MTRLSFKKTVALATTLRIRKLPHLPIGLSVSLVELLRFFWLIETFRRKFILDLNLGATAQVDTAIPVRFHLPAFEAGRGVSTLSAGTECGVVILRCSSGTHGAA